MHWYDRVAARLKDRAISKAEVGRAMPEPLTGQAVTMKLQGKRPVSVEELTVFARMAGLTVAEALGDDVVIELEDEIDLVNLYRLLTPDQKARFIGMLRDVAKPQEET